MKRFIKERGWIEHAALVGWTLLAILYRGWGFPVGDQNLYLPFVLKWANSELFPNDYLLSLNYARESVTWFALSWATRLFDLQVVVGVAYFLTSYLTLWAILRLAEVWLEDTFSAWIAVLLWTPVYLLPGNGMNTVDPYFTGRGLAYVFCFWALLFLLRQRTAGVILCVCGGALVHPISVIPVMGAAGLYYLFRKQWRNLTILSASVAGTALFLLVLASGGGPRNLRATYDPQWYDIALSGARCLFPSDWGPNIWGRLLLYAALAGVVLLMTLGPQDAVPRKAVGWALFASSLALWAVSWVGAAGRVVLLVQLSLMRSCLFLILLVCLALADWSAKLVRAGPWPNILAASAALGAWMTDQPKLQAMAVLVGAVTAAAPWKGATLTLAIQRGRVTMRTGLLALILATVGLYCLDFYAGKFLPFPSPNGWTIAQAMVLGSVLSLGWLFLPQGRSRKAGIVMASAFGLSLLVQPTAFAIQSLGSLPGLNLLYGLSRGHVFTRKMAPPSNHRDREKLAKVVRTEVPPDATVIVPAGWDNFRVMARRSSFVTLEDMVPAEFNRAYAMEWRSRMQVQYGQNHSTPIEKMIGEASLDSQGVLALVKRYPHLNIGYVVTTRIYPFPEVAKAG